MTSTVPAAAGPEQTFTDLGAQAIRLAGYGTQETYLGVNQSQFGGPVSAISLQLRGGTHTAVPTGGQAALSVYWNDNLLSSQTLDGDTFDVTAGQIQSRKGLRLRLTALPAGGDCSGPAGLLPMGLTVDTSGSKVTARRGHSIKPGFPRFPQVLGTTLRIGFDAGATSQQNTINAATLAFSLQRDNDSLLDVRLTTPRRPARLKRLRPPSGRHSRHRRTSRRPAPPGRVPHRIQQGHRIRSKQRPLRRPGSLRTPR